MTLSDAEVALVNVGANGGVIAALRPDAVDRVYSTYDYPNGHTKLRLTSKMSRTTLTYIGFPLQHIYVFLTEFQAYIKEFVLSKEN